MTNKQINITIAEAVGWEGHPFLIDMMGNQFPGWDTPQNYSSDLNRMHEAEKVLSQMEQDQYWDHLKDITDEGFYHLHASARQRAEAFLRTIGKWEE